MSRSRYPAPEYLVGAATFSDDPRNRDPLRIIALMRAQTTVWKQLQKHTTTSHSDGRPRMPGHWLLAYLAFVISREVDVQPWHAASSPDVWRAAGFRAKPSYSETWLRFGELEDARDAVIDAIGELVAAAQRVDPAIGRYIAIDSTEADSHSRLHHDCGPDDDCPRRPAIDRRRRRRRPPGLRMLTAYEAGVLRNDAFDKPEPPEPSSTAPPVQLDFFRQRMVRVRLAGCWWRTFDPEIGVRTYTGAEGRTIRTWLGTYHQHAVDHRTGLRVMVRVDPASRNESDIYPDLIDRIEHIGLRPLAITADRGFAVNSVFELNTRRGIASVIPLRRPVADHDTLRYDRDGMPRCPACGGQTEQIRFTHKTPGSPRIWYRCRFPVTDGCRSTAPDASGALSARQRSLATSNDWRRLVPLSRLHPTYHELDARHHNLEHAHHDARTRHRAGGKDTTSRPKRRGIGVQELRALTGILLDWVVYLARLRQPRPPIIRRTRLTARAAEHLKALLRRRSREGLDVPYGPAAARLHLGLPTPPSDR